MIRPLLAIVLGLISAGCGPSGTTTPVINAEPVGLYPEAPERTDLGALRYAGGLVLTSDDPRFGGLSALSLSEDGARLIALSDRGHVLTAALTFQDGAPAGVADVAFTPLTDAGGRPLEGPSADAEGMADLGEGRFAISFEREHRIEVFALGVDGRDAALARPEPFRVLPGADRLRANAGVEALATAGGALYAGIEEPVVDGTPHLVWRYDLADPSNSPRALSLSLEPGFGLTALAPDGAGGLIVASRFWARDIGNRIRIDRLSAADLAAGGGPLVPDRLAAFEPGMTVDNIEAAALAVIDGEPRLFLMSDDNFSDTQRTLLLSFTFAD